MFLFLTFCVFALFSCRLFLLISVGGGGGRHGVWRQSRTVDEVGGMLMISLVVMKGKGWGREGAISCFLITMILGDNCYGGDDLRSVWMRLFLAFCEAGQEMGDDGWGGA